MVDEAAATAPDSGKSKPDIPWLRATAKDFRNLDFEAPVQTSNVADCGELASLYRTALQSSPDGSAASRVFSMLEAVTGMYFKPEDRFEPFGPMFEGPTSRSAISADFRGHVEVLEELLARAKIPILKARLSDLCALLDRRRGKLGLVAISAYVETVEKVDAGEFRFRFDEQSKPLSHHTYELLRRALQLGRMFGWDKPETIRARNLAVTLRQRADASLDPNVAHKFSKLDIDFGLTDPPTVAHSIESLITALGKTLDFETAADLWRLAARARTSDKAFNAGRWAPRRALQLDLVQSPVDVLQAPLDFRKLFGYGLLLCPLQQVPLPLKKFCDLGHDDLRSVAPGVSPDQHLLGATFRQLVTLEAPARSMQTAQLFDLRPPAAAALALDSGHRAFRRGPATSPRTRPR